MKMGIKALSLNGKGLWSRILKGTIYALCFSLVFILVFAFMLKFTGIAETLITPINQLIKGVSIFLGVFIALKKEKQQGLICGLLIGFLFTIFAFLTFSLLSGTFVFDKTFLTDMVFGAIIGGICGIIAVNLKKSIK